MIVSRVKEGSLLLSSKDIGIIASGDNQVAFVSSNSILIGFKQVKNGTIMKANKCDVDLQFYSKSIPPLVVAVTVKRGLQ